MPYTLAHPAIVLPLRRLGLPTSALVIGSMVPDLPLFVPTPAALSTSYRLTHSAVGIVSVDLAVTLLAVLVWRRVLRAPALLLAPIGVREQLAAQAARARGWRALLAMPVAAVLGAASHVGWDSFTHRGRWGVQHVGWLAERHGPLMGYAWAQYLSGVIGLAVIAITCSVAVVRLSRVTAGHDDAGAGTVWARLPAAVPALTWCLVAGVGLTALTAAAASTAGGLRAVAYAGAVTGVQSAVVGLFLVAAWWWARERARPPRAAP